MMEPRISVITLGVSDFNRAWQFYKDLGLPTQMTPDSGIVVFTTTGTRLSLYPRDKLAEDVGLDQVDTKAPNAFSGITLAHTVREKSHVDQILAKAASIGGKVVKPAQDVFWGGYSGYFADPDGHLWEINYSEMFQFEEDGSLKFPS